MQNLIYITFGVLFVYVVFLDSGGWDIYRNQILNRTYWVFMVSVAIVVFYQLATRILKMTIPTAPIYMLFAPLLFFVGRSAIRGGRELESNGLNDFGVAVNFLGGLMFILAPIYTKG